MRLDKLLANTGFGSRKEVKKLLKLGQITVNDELVKEPQKKINLQEDRVCVNHEQVHYEEFVYFILNKPAGVVSATEDSRDRTVIDLLADEDRLTDPFPVGRLDKDTEGLLLITNDGKLAHRLLSPKKNVGKTYYAKIEGNVTVEDQAVFQKGVILDDGYQTKEAQLTILQSGPISEIELTIFEGKYHQVKRMFEAVHKRVIYLKRIAMGEWLLDPKLKLGEYRRLTEAEIAYLKALN
ncbi:pseudouridine synthase [Amphibacillus cookii]|uniref:pseudouridine synthase n=1 Tax=Amphibacillus cookii TaxID=767787 RepID=UPI00195640FB|nr:pseudouridine synthase [Amphibacillus cookii]MBM7542975.1 16S rRNA pseudouridine516 synthase [Amphibacillus cookii]